MRLLTVALALLWPWLTTAMAQGAKQRAATARERGTASADPYTAGDPARLAALGYLGFGPFPLAASHATTDVDRVIGAGRMRWVETAHFKIGVDLPRYDVPPGDRAQRSKLVAELRQLHATLPRVDPARRILDPWLRLHLTALRCEALYAEFANRVVPLPTDSTSYAMAVDLDGRGRGLGPFLGKDEKFIVLVFGSTPDLARYSTEFAGATHLTPQRHDFGRAEGLLFMTALGVPGGLHDDSRLHCQLAFGIVANLLDGYAGCFTDLPAWLKTGSAQWFAHAIDPRYPQFDAGIVGGTQRRKALDWEERARELAARGLAPSFADLGQRRSFEGSTIHDHVIAWSFAAFLLESEENRFGRFLAALKGDWHGELHRSAWETMMDRQSVALREILHCANAVAFDSAWREWVMDP